MVSAKRGKKYWVAAKTRPYQLKAEPCTKDTIGIQLENSKILNRNMDSFDF